MKDIQVTHATVAHDIISSRIFEKTNEGEQIVRAIELTWFFLCKVEEALKDHKRYCIEIDPAEHELIYLCRHDMKIHDAIEETMLVDHGYHITYDFGWRDSKDSITISWKYPKPIPLWRELWYFFSAQWVHDKAWVAKRLKKVWDKQRKEMMK